MGFVVACDLKMAVDANMSETELDELLTGNEEVLDQGVLGINFRKFMPQVDFIRQSEVFKFLQNQNVHKELSEEVQLEKEPTKRFSTFLQKPRAPPRKPLGPLWIHPRAPRYLSKEERKPQELPRGRPRKPRTDPGHSVLWLFLSEDGEDVEDERWGTDEEERCNLSRNEYIEYDRSSVMSMKSRSEGTYSNLDNPIPDSTGDASCEASENEDVSNHQTEKKGPRFVAKCTIEEIAELEDNEVYKTQKPVRGRLEPDESTNAASRPESKRGKTVQVDVKETTEVSQHTCEESMTSVTTESAKFKSKREEEEHKFSKQLADIKAQIAALEDQAPPDLQDQLLSIHDHLEKIVRLKLAQSAQYQEEKIHYEEKLEESSEEMEEEEEIEIEEKITEKTIIEERVEEKIIEKTETKVVLVDENGVEVEEDFDEDFVEDGELGEDVGDGVTAFKKGEYEICEAAPPRKSRGPITPLARPIVLPGGRQWRQPKDAACDEFYTGVLVAQADVLIGSDEGGVNFTKYVPPKFDMSHSAVFRLIQEIEDKSNKDKPIDDFYQAPLNKRHFYAAKLKPPPPIGEVELKDL